MIVEPYKLRPVAPRVALLQPDGRPVSEDGELLDLDNWPKGTRLWCSYDTARALVIDGHGEGLCWRNEEIRWRHRRFEDDWQPRPSDANVIKLPFDHLPFEQQLRGFAAWRDWLTSYGAAPTGTSGSAAWSLLRARLERTLWTSVGDRPPITWTLGGRQELGPAGRGSFTDARQLDLQAAYASTLAGLRYGGRKGGGEWRRDRLGYERDGDDPVFVRAQVRVPAMRYGPLPRRPRRRPRTYLESQLFASYYPTGRRVQGVWTREELAAAETVGCGVRVLEAWVHRSGWYPFAPWWAAIQEGRALGGLAGQLAKVTGNALWGRFCMDGDARRSIRSRGRRKVESRVLASRPFLHAAHDLAETVSGRVRARLFLEMTSVGDRLLSAHTDGLWASTTDAAEADGWRLKTHARRLDVLNPQLLRWWPEHPAPWEPAVVAAGVPSSMAAGVFEREWAKAQPLPSR